ncbi:MAG: hypothetical protein HMLIMOIP_001854 [Candidatus Nitrosomirales archaeon]
MIAVPVLIVLSIGIPLILFYTDPLHHELNFYLPYGLMGLLVGTIAIAFGWVRFGVEERSTVRHNWKAIIWIAGFFIVMYFLMRAFPMV